MSTSKDIAAWMRQQVTVSGARGIVVGLSGGIDSAVVVRLAQMAAPGQVVGVIMPCHSDPQDEADARLVAGHFAVPTVRIDLEAAYDRFVADLRTAAEQLPADLLPPAPAQPADIKARMPLANVKPRLRMATLYFVANTLNYLVAGTGNRSELTIGYFTKYGDGGVDLLPIGKLLKSEVRAMARELDVPERVITKAPSAGLWLGQTDEQEMGFTYADLEHYLMDGPDAVSPALAMRIERLMRTSDHKRTVAPTPDV
ncbi:MAG: NAD(+) synthase [Acidobacteria bacterium RIFCSPLOWO2_02_FULL_67_36]|nr:MAG: NAD(+) synthase [Acidobacteria bacterium RIFCSPLOWO2_02_FULL_67_36]OFW25814.1 MAG: NAD(+) synthase [Acidobacteria bacterium RIFCSPLOWO2_12_FULL_66_21]